MRLALALILSACAFGQPSTNVNTLVIIPKTDLSATGEMRFRDKQASSHYVGFKAPSSVSANTMWELPGANAAGSLNNDGAGNLSWGSSGATVTNGFVVSDKTAVGPPVTVQGWQAWYNQTNHSTNWLSYDNANNLSQINLSASQFNVIASTLQTSGNVLPNAIGTLSIGSKSVPFGAGYFLNNVSSRKLEVYGSGGTDLNGLFWNVLANTDVVSKEMSFNDTSNVPLLTLSRLIGGVAISRGTLDGDWMPGTTGTRDLGSNSLRWRKLWVGDMDISGTVTGAPWVLKSGDTMSGNLLANAVGTLSLGSSAVPWGSTFSLTNVSSRKIQVYDFGASDLTGPFWNINSTDGVVTKTLTFNDDANLPVMILYRLNGGITAKKGEIDGDWVPHTTNTYSLGTPPSAGALQWKDINWQGSLIQNGTTRLDSSGNLTVASCSGCGGVTNGFFVTGNSAVGSSTAMGLQVSYDTSVHASNIKSYDAANTLGPVNLSASQLSVNAATLQTSGNVLPNAIGTLSVGSKSIPFGAGYYLNNMSSRKVEIYGSGGTDLNGLFWNVLANTDVVSKELSFNDTSNVPLLTLSRLIGGVAISRAALDGDFMPGTTGTRDIGSSALRWKKLWVGDMDISGTVTGAPWVLKAGDTMSGNLNANAIGTLSLGSASVPFGSVFALTNLSTRKLQVYGSGGADLTGGAFWSITGTDDVVSKALSFVDDTSLSILTLTRLAGGVGVNRADFDAHVTPLTSNSRDIGGANLWRDIYWAGRLMQNGNTRVDASGNATFLTLACSSSPCGTAVSNGFFVTNNTAVTGTPTAMGLQMSYDTSTHASSIKSYDSVNGTAPITVTSSLFSTSSHSPISNATSPLGDSSHRWLKLWAQDMDLNGTITYSGGSAPWLNLGGGTMTGNINANAIATLSLGSASVPFGSVWSQTNVSTRKLQIYPSDITHPDLSSTNFWNIQVTDDASSKTMTVADDGGGTNPLIIFRLTAGVADKRGVFDGAWNPSTTNLYSLGSASVQWLDHFFTGRLVQNGTVRLDAAGNLTVMSCSGCSGATVANGFFVTGQTTVGPPTTVVGLQVYHDPSTHSSFIKSYNASNTPTSIDFTGFTNHNQQASFQGGINFGSTPTISDNAGVAMQINGANTGNGNVLVTPGSVAGNASLRVFQAINSQPAVKVINFAGATTSTVFEVDNSNQTTARFWIESDGNSTTTTGCASCVHTANLIPTQDGTQDVGLNALRYGTYRGFAMQLGLVPVDVPAGTVGQLSTTGISLMVIDSYASGVPSIVGRNAGCTFASPCAIGASQPLFSFSGRGYIGGGYSPSGSAAITILSNENWGPSNQGADIYFQTTPAGFTNASRATRMIVSSNGINPPADNTGTLGTTGPCVNGGGSPCRWNNANFLNATIGTLNVISCIGCPGGASLSANNTWTGSNIFNNSTSLGSNVFISGPVFFSGGGVIGSSVLPNSTNTWDLGSATFQWNRIVANIGNFTSVSAVGGTTSFIGGTASFLGGSVSFSSTTAVTAPNGAAGVNCSGPPSAAFASSLGIVTHC